MYMYIRNWSFLHLIKTVVMVMLVLYMCPILSHDSHVTCAKLVLVLYCVSISQNRSIVIVHGIGR